MLNTEIEKLIVQSIKSQDKVRLETLRSIKAEFMKYKTAKDAKPLDENAEIGILKKMVKQRKESALEYRAGNREELALSEEEEISILQEFLPKEVSKEEIEKECPAQVNKAEMSKVISELKTKFPGAEGSLIASIVKSRLNV